MKIFLTVYSLAVVAAAGMLPMCAAGQEIRIGNVDTDTDTDTDTNKGRDAGGPLRIFEVAPAPAPISFPPAQAFGQAMPPLVAAKKRLRSLGTRVLGGNPDDDVPVPEPTTAVNCFSSAPAVRTMDRGDISMKDLKVGDKVLTDPKDNTKYQSIYAFAHRVTDTDVETDFLQLETRASDKQVLEITVDHLLYVQGHANPIRAGTIQVGDQLVYNDGNDKPVFVPVTNITRIQRQGIFAPLTLDGSILVNGIKTSVYASPAHPNATEYVEFTGGFSSGISQHTLSHILFSPMRMICLGVVAPEVCAAATDNELGVPLYVTLILKIATWAQDSTLVVQMLVMAVVLFICGSSYAIELLVGPYLAPWCVVSLVSSLVYLHRCKGDNVGKMVE